MVVWGCRLSWKTVTSSPGNRMVSAQPVGTSSHCMGTPKSRDQAVRRLSVKPAFFSSVFQGSDRAPKAFVKTNIIYTIPGVLVPCCMCVGSLFFLFFSCLLFLCSFFLFLCVLVCCSLLSVSVPASLVVFDELLLFLLLPFLLLGIVLRLNLL